MKIPVPLMRQKPAAARHSAARYKPVVQGYAAQANAEAAQDDLRLAVPGIAEQVFIAVVKHGAAGFIRHSDAVHDENEGGEHSGQVAGSGLRQVPGWRMRSAAAAAKASAAAARRYHTGRSSCRRCLAKNSAFR